MSAHFCALAVSLPAALTQSAYCLSCLELAPDEPPPLEEEPEEPDPEDDEPPSPSPPSWLSSWSNGLAPDGAAIVWPLLRSSSWKSSASVPDSPPPEEPAGAVIDMLMSIRRNVLACLPVKI